MDDMRQNSVKLGVAHNNTDGNKLVIFSGIAFYYGDTYIVTITRNHK